MTPADATVFVVDDDTSVRTALKILIQSLGFKLETFDSAESLNSEYSIICSHQPHSQMSAMTNKNF